MPYLDCTLEAKKKEDEALEGGRYRPPPVGRKMELGQRESVSMQRPRKEWKREGRKEGGKEMYA